MGIEGIDMGKNLEHLVENHTCSVYQIKNETGEGLITMYEVLEGVYITYNDFHMSYCDSQLESHIELLCIDHCREGRIEEAGGERYKYLSAGDLRVDNRAGHKTVFSFPFTHYHGMSVAFDIQKAQASLKRAFTDFSIDLTMLKEKYCTHHSNFVIRDIEAINHLFSELYRVPEEIKMPYFRIKVYELLLFLQALEVSDFEDKGPYFYKTTVEKVKAIHKEIVTNLDKHFTLDYLASTYDVPLTTLKKCFKGLYGDSIYAYTKHCRINHGAKLLLTTSLSVADIALSVGYGSPSKFTASFKKIMGMTPMAYRKKR